MLSSRHRMRRSADFTAAVRRGARAGRSRLVVHIAPPEPSTAPGGESATVGFIVSRAVGNAAVRNRVKRRLRHLMRDRLGHIPAGARVVVRALPPAAGATSAELASDLDGALSRSVARLAPNGGS
ncbi:MAG TPA: ribonuclease P protein component [Actinomycetales bacterium]|nr:ribonuclease P protein component [Actinomycetales bacterium]